MFSSSMLGRRNRASRIGPERLCYSKRNCDSLVSHQIHRRPGWENSAVGVRSGGGEGEVDQWGLLEVFTSSSLSSPASPPLRGPYLTLHPGARQRIRIIQITWLHPQTH